ncbi:ribosome-binding factor A [Alphaproteobacteria bacterium]|nr:ribosome-binding factor A [Alphaproteobacteria bacterium]
MHNKPSFRTQKIELTIKRLIAEYIVTHKEFLIEFPTLRMEITDARVSKDLRFAKVLLVHNIKDIEFEKFKKKYTRKMQELIAKTMTSKYIPKISLYVDEPYKESIKVQQLIDQL